MAKRNSYGGGGMGGGMNMNSMLAKAQKMQADMAAAQAEVEAAEVEATAGGGVVTVHANGAKKILSIKISPEAVDPDDVEMLEDLITAAVNEALAKAEDMMQQKMGGITGGMNLGGMF
jgi:DNA-binding YbaB/EbfC family protein